MSGVLVLLVTGSLMGALHSHPVDHDGGTLHMETDHGDHILAVAGLDDGMVSAPPDAGPTLLPSLPVPESPGASSGEWAQRPAETYHSGRDPPLSGSPRGPPHLS